MSAADNFSSVWAEIDLSALKANARAIRSAISDPSVEILAVVKADAYGHGMPEVSKVLWSEGVHFFGVANLDEALALRRILAHAHILVLGSFHASQIPLFISKKIIPSVSSVEDLRLLSRAAKYGRPFSVHVKIDTGMGRLGLPSAETESFFKEAKKFPAVKIEGVYTHFSSADDQNTSHTKKQLEIFSQKLKQIQHLGFRPKWVHASNSMGMLRFKDAHFNLVRPGLVLYGIKPSPQAKLPRGIKPVLAWKTRISFLKKFSPGQTVSYGRTHRVTKNTLIAALPVGYSHGYRVAFSGCSSVLVGGRRCRVAGRVTMDQILVDVGGVPGVRRWDEAVLIGAQRKEAISAEELAVLARTIPYEIVCAIHSRVPRIYKKAS